MMAMMESMDDAAGGDGVVVKEASDPEDSVRVESSELAKLGTMSTIKYTNMALMDLAGQIIFSDKLKRKEKLKILKKMSTYHIIPLANFLELYDGVRKVDFPFKINDIDYIPKSIRQCVEFLKHEKALSHPFLFARNASYKKIQDWLYIIEHNEDFELVDINVAAAILKGAIRNNEELFPLLNYQRILKFSGKKEQNKVAEAKLCLSGLSVGSLELFKYLLNYFRMVVEYRQLNKMDGKNIAIVLAPSLIPKTVNATLEGAVSMANYVEFMMSQHHKLL